MIQSNEIQLKPITLQNISSLKSINSILFPVVYAEKFYLDVCCTYPSSYSRLVYSKNNPIGAICCRREDLSTGKTRVYIMTLGILSGYRRRGLGSCLLNYILQQTYSDTSISSFALHVHVENHHAIEFYKLHGFHIHERLYGYYASNLGIEPPDAYLLVKFKDVL